MGSKDWSVPETEDELEARLVAYKRDGYTIFPRLYSAEQMAEWQAEQNRLEEASVGMFAPSGPNESPARNHWFGNMLERSPHLMWPAVSNARVLDFAERVVGPLVQLDNLTLAAFPPAEASKREELRGTASGYHRDRWGRMPNGSYERPLAFNAITYLQDLTDETGPLRIIPKSHLSPIEIKPETGGQPQPGEQLIYMQAGDTIMTHTSLLHSGSPNLSLGKRYFFSVYYNITWLKHTDTFSGPNCAQLISWARNNGDHRALRLLGEDDQLQQRANSGFQQPDEQRWAAWREEDARVLAEAQQPTAAAAKAAVATTAAKL